MRKLIEVLEKYYLFFLFLILELIGFFMLVRYNTYHQISYLSWTNEITGNVNERFSNVTEHLQLVEDNAVLAEENALLKEQVKQSYLFAGDQFNPWIDTIYQQNYVYRTAKVINNELSKQDNYMMINVGTLSGVKTGMGVIDSRGIVGIVTDVSEHYAVVMSVLNSKFHLGVRLKSTGYFGLLNWDGEDPNLATLKDVQQFVDVQIGDSIETLGGSGIFPEGIFTGVVEKIEPIEESNTWQITIALSSHIQRAKHVYVMENIFEDEIQLLEDSIE
jgi:rod shape-determining protein MreC